MEECTDLLDRTDSRFKELLAPHRDLAANWGVDVAVQLLEYAASIGIHLPPINDDHNLSSPSSSGALPVRSSASSTDTSVDFAHAALILQGSTNIYSKKIDHLYGLVLAAVDAVSNLGDKNGRKTPANADGKGNDTDKPGAQAFDIDSVDFLAIADEDIEQAEPRQISIQTDDISSDESIDDPTRRRPIPPMLTQNLNVSAGSSLEKSKFKMYSAILHPSGALLTEGCPPVDENLEAILRPRQLHLATSTSDAALSPTPPYPLSLGDDDDPTLLPDDDESEGNADNNISNQPDGNGEALLPFQSQTGDSCDMFSANLPENSSLSNRREPMPKKDSRSKRDPFELLDPHNPQNDQHRPLRVGKTYRQPRAKRRRKPLISCGMATLDVSALLNSLIGPIPKNASSVTYTTTPAAAPQLRALLRSRRLQNVSHSHVDDALYDENDDSLSIAEVGRSAGDGLHDEHMGADDILLFGDGLDDEPLEFGEDAGPLSNEADDVILAGGVSSTKDKSSGLETTIHTSGRKSKLDGGLELLASNYAATCEEYLKKTAWMWEQRAVDLKLAKRVSDWSSRIHPLLEKEEQRGEFDIRKYGDIVISRLKALDRGNGEAASGKMSVILSAQENFEVSRLFLATLQLTNQYNVNIESEQEPCRVCDPVVRLLAVEGESAFQTPCGGAKRKRIVGSTPSCDKRKPFRVRTTNRVLEL